MYPPASALAPAQAKEHADLDAIHKIKAEAFENSKVMDHTCSDLADVKRTALRLTRIFAAAGLGGETAQRVGHRCARGKMGTLGRGWAYTRFSANPIAPQYAPLVGFPLAWSAGTNGVVSGEPIHIDQPATEAELEKLKGTLKGKIVLMGAPRDLAMLAEAPGRRFTDADLAAMLAAPDPGSVLSARRAPRSRPSP